MQVIPEPNQKALKVMKCFCVICECIDIYPYYPSHFQFKQHIIYQLCCQMLHVIVLNRKLGGREGRTDGRRDNHSLFPQENCRVDLALDLVTIYSFQVLPWYML